MHLLNKITAEDVKKLKILFFDFDGVFTDNFVYISQSGDEQIKCSRLDGIGLSKIKKIGLIPMIISTEKNKVVTKRADKLGVICHQSVHDKASKINDICCEYGVCPKDQLFLGNDENDIAALDFVGIPVAVKDYHPSIAEHAKYVTQAQGGKGAVREVCDLVNSLILQGK